MKQVVERGMQVGAWGISSGLIYVPSRYARTAELVELAKVAHRHGGLYASHIRSEGAGLLDAIDEAIAVGKESGAPVHISHLKASGKANWGMVGPALERIAEARAAGPARHGRPVSLHRLEHDAGRDGRAALGRPGERRGLRPAGRRSRARGRSCAGRSSGSSISATVAASIRIARYAPRPDWAGLDLVAIAATKGRPRWRSSSTSSDTASDQAISFGMSETTSARSCGMPFVATASDGSTHLPGRDDQPHPRAYGTFPRKIRYALDEKVITLEAGDPVVLGLAGRDPRPARPRRHPRGRLRRPRRHSIPRRSATRRPSRSRPATRPGVRYLYVNGVALIAEGKLHGIRFQAEAPRPGPSASSERPGRVDRQGGTDLDR